VLAPKRPAEGGSSGHRSSCSFGSSSLGAKPRLRLEWEKLALTARQTRKGPRGGGGSRRTPARKCWTAPPATQARRGCRRCPEVALPERECRRRISATKGGGAARGGRERRCALGVVIARGWQISQSQGNLV
jgi:hypothetical protein